MTEAQELSASMKCIKYMFFVVNLMFVLVGLLLTLIGSTVKTIYRDFDYFLSNEYYSSSNLAIAVGVCIFVIALFGCIGANKGSVCLINVYTFLLVCVLILEIAVSVLAYSMRTRLVKEIEWNMYVSMDNYGTSSRNIWDATQYNLRCCGVHSPKDWTNFEYDRLENVTRNGFVYYTVPGTCCRDINCVDINSVYKLGCLDKVIFVVSESALLLGIGAMSVACIQLLGITFSHLLAKSLRRLKTQILVEDTTRRQEMYEQLSRAQNKEKCSPVFYTPSEQEP